MFLSFFLLHIHRNDTDSTITVAIGEFGYSGGFEAGRVRIFQLIYDPFTNSYSLNPMGEIPGENNGDQAGWSVALALNSNGTIVAIGEPGHNGSQNNGSKGRIRIFQYNGTSWIPIGEKGGESYGDTAGSSVALNNDGFLSANLNIF